MFENNNVPIWKKVTLTINEACQYSNIGEKTMRALLNEANCPFALSIGKKKLVKREIFETWLNNQSDIG